MPCCKQAWVQTLGSVCTPSGPKGENELKTLSSTSSTRLPAQTHLPTTHHPAAAITVLPHTRCTRVRSLNPLPEQRHPQNSRYTPRSPSAVLWTPCGGVERVRPFRSQGFRDAQAACEPGVESLCTLIDYATIVRPPPPKRP